MKDSIDHLPSSKQKNLTYICDVLRDELEQVTGFANGTKKHGRILKIILFGSYATGKWVNKPAYGYVSDYDILVMLTSMTSLKNIRFGISRRIVSRCECASR